MNKTITNSRPKIWTKDFVLLFISNLLIAFSFQMLTPTLPFYLMNSLGVETSKVGIYLSAYVIAVLAIRPFSGYFTDKFPRRTLFIIMALVFSITFSLYLLTTLLTLFIIIRLIHGGAWSMVSTAGSTLAIDILPAQRRGEGIGFFGLSMTLAMALGPMTGLFLYENFHFDIIFYTAIITSFIGFVISFFIKTNPGKSNDNSPISFDRFFYTKAIPEFIVFMMITISYGFAVSYAAMYGEYLGIKNTAIFFICMSIGTILSRFTIGKLIDRGTETNIATIGLIALTLILVGFSFCINPFIYFGLGFLYGMTFGILMPTFQTLILNMAPHNRRGTANSTFFIGFDLGLGTGMLMGGWLIAKWSYTGMYLVGGIFNVIAFLMFITFVKSHYKRNKLIR